MQAQTDPIKLKAYKILILFFSIIALILTYYLTNLYLESNFSYNGEAYLKGAGHLLREDFRKALVFLITRHLMASTILCFLGFSLLLKEARKQLFKTLSYAAVGIAVLVLAYTILQVYNIYVNGYDVKDRTIEIALTWSSRVMGFYLGFWLSKTVVKQ
jgi:multisubunit Na+/H+ antiporter MnhB subunit